MPTISDGTRLNRIVLTIWGTIGALTLAGFVWWIGEKIRIIWLPVVFATGIVVILNPLVTFLQRLRLPRILGATVAYVLSVVVLIGLGSALSVPVVQQAEEFADRLPEIYDALYEQVDSIADTLGLLLFPAAFLLVYLGFCGLMARAVGDVRTAGELSRAFVFSLVPIALAYNIAHFFTLLVVQGQLLVPLSSDPLGRGWDLFGTAEYVTDIGVVSARAVWFLSVGAIVAGHIAAVYLAHHTATRLFGDRALAMRSQYPMLALMVMYTVVSLWIVAQPIVE